MKNVGIVSNPDWRAETVRVSGPGIGAPARITLAELRRAAQQEDREYAAIYADLAHRAYEAIEAARTEEVRRCSGHRAISEQVYCFSGPIVSAEENRAAHGNICRVEECRCGARRLANINQHHIEQGLWG